MAISLLNSLRKRFVMTASLLLFLSIAMFSYIETNLINNSQNTPRVIHKHQLAFQSLESIRHNLRRLESTIYQYTVLLNEESRTQAMDYLSELNALDKQVISERFMGLNESLNSSYIRLRRINGEIDHEVRGLMQVLSESDRRFPSAPILRNELLPLNQSFTQELQLSISDENIANENPRSRSFDVQPKLLKLRYYWMQQISTVRSFIANRTGIFDNPSENMQRNLEDRQLYSELIDDTLDWLAGVDMKSGLTIQQSISLKQMRHYKAEYDKAFERVKAIYMSESWRRDYPLIRDKIHPLFARAWAIIDGMDMEFQTLNSESQMSLYGTANQLQGFIWLFNVAALLVVFIAYLSFEYLMRRPVKQMALAMKAHASGVDFFPEIHSNIAENKELVSAFNHMKREVDSRQRKLESILDNAAEGIIAFDGEGQIVNFNKTAEELFLVRAEEVVGRYINNYIPDLFDEQRVFGFMEKERELPVEDLVIEIPRRDGAKFIASIKISRMLLEGEYYFTVLISDISEQVEMLNNLKRVAERDSLTGLYNRKFLLERVDELFDSVNSDFDALLYVDLDNFKFANDTLGHLAGDQILIEVTQLLQERMREQDLLARLGGDEFAILLHGVSEIEAVEAANAFRMAISDYHFVHAGKTIDIGCSIGVALKSADILHTQELLAKADYACHVAKTKGRNMVHLYHVDDRREVAAIYADMGWTRIIKRALENDRFFLVAQPIVNSRERTTFAREVLIRLNDQNSTIAMPNGFIPAAERFGLMPDIDRWVIGRTIGYLQEDLMQGVESRYSINLSAATFNDPGTLDYIRYLIEHSRVNPDKLIFEITETMAITHIKTASKVLEGLRAMGCRTALDDFGAGHASYLYLKDLPVDYVKIDGSFIRDLLKEPLHLAMVRSMKEVADAVGIQTIAEYVEDEETMELLCDIGIDYIQGYFSGRPQPLRAAEESKALPQRC